LSADFSQPIIFNHRIQTANENVIGKWAKTKKITYVMNDLSNFVHIKTNKYG
jgi:hypothetical protein